MKLDPAAHNVITSISACGDLVMHSAVNTVTFNSVIKPAKGRHVQDHLAHEVGTDLSAGESENIVTSNHSIKTRELESIKSN